MIKAFENLEIWFVTGAQVLYGGETVKIVDGHSNEMDPTIVESFLLRLFIKAQQIHQPK